MSVVSFSGRLSFGMRPDGRTACGSERNVTRLEWLYFWPRSPSGADDSGMFSVPSSARGEWQVTQPLE